MALWTRLREELDHAGRIAQGAVDEGRLRLELYRARQNADRFAQRFGYAAYRGKRDGHDLSAEEYSAHINNITAAEAEITRYEKLVDEAAQRRRGSNDAPKPPEP